MKRLVNTNGVEYQPDKFNVKMPAFSGSDIVTIMYIQGIPLTLHNISLISIDTNRNITPVPTLGEIRVKYYNRGHRMIAGTISFYVTSDGPIPLFGLNTVYPGSYGHEKQRSGNPLIDEIPPFDILISYMDEYGRSSQERLYGVILYRLSKVISINDLVTEVQTQYFALDIDNQFITPRQYEYDPDMAENIIIANNISALEYEKNRIHNILTNSNSYADGDKYTYRPLASEELGYIGPEVTREWNSKSWGELKKEYDKYTRVITRILRQTNAPYRIGETHDPVLPYLYGDRPYDFPRE